MIKHKSFIYVATLVSCFSSQAFMAQGINAAHFGPFQPTLAVALSPDQVPQNLVREFSLSNADGQNYIADERYVSLAQDADGQRIVVTLKASSANMTLTQLVDEPVTNVRFVIENGFQGTLYLNKINMDVVNATSPAFTVHTQATSQGSATTKATLHFVGDAHLRGSADAPVIRFANANPDLAEDERETLTITGPGTLYAESVNTSSNYFQRSSLIGGGGSQEGNNIVIENTKLDLFLGDSIARALGAGHFRFDSPPNKNLKVIHSNVHITANYIVMGPGLYAKDSNFVLERDPVQAQRDGYRQLEFGAYNFYEVGDFTLINTSMRFVNPTGSNATSGGIYINANNTTINGNSNIDVDRIYTNNLSVSDSSIIHGEALSVKDSAEIKDSAQVELRHGLMRVRSGEYEGSPTNSVKIHGDAHFKGLIWAHNIDIYGNATVVARNTYVGSMGRLPAIGSFDSATYMIHIYDNPTIIALTGNDGWYESDSGKGAPIGGNEYSGMSDTKKILIEGGTISLFTRRSYPLGIGWAAGDNPYSNVVIRGGSLRAETFNSSDYERNRKDVLAYDLFGEDRHQVFELRYVDSTETKLKVDGQLYTRSSALNTRERYADEGTDPTFYIWAPLKKYYLIKPGDAAEAKWYERGDDKILRDASEAFSIRQNVEEAKAGDPLTLSIDAVLQDMNSSVETYSFEWQKEEGQGTWSALTDGSEDDVTYEGSRTGSLSISKVDRNTARLRLVIKNASGEEVFATSPYSPVFATAKEPTITEHATYNHQEQTMVTLGEHSELADGSAALSAKDAGTYTVKVKPSSGYTWEDGTTDPKSYSYTIDPKEVTISADDASYGYGETIDIQPTLVGLYEGDYTLTTNWPTAIGSYNIDELISIGLGANEKNYALTWNTGTLKILPLAKIQVPTAQNVSYTGEAFSAFSVPEHVSVGKGSTLSATDAGDYQVSLTPDEGYTWDDGSELGASGEKTISWHILPAVVAMPEEKLATFSYTGALQRVSIPYGLEYVSGDQEMIYAGSYSISLRPDANHRWQTSSDESPSTSIVRARRSVDTGREERSFSWEITARPYSVTTDSAERDYTGEALQAPGRLLGVVEGDASFEMVGSQTDAGSSTNSYRIQWKSADVERSYKLNSEELGTLTVHPSKSAVPPQVQENLIYNGKAQQGLVLGAHTHVVEGSIEQIYADTYSVRIAPDTNYAWENGTTDALSYSFVILPKELKVITDSAQKVFDGKELSAPGRVEGLVEGDARLVLTGSITTPGTASNTYELQFRDEKTKASYTITEELGTLSVEAQTLPVEEKSEPAHVVKQKVEAKALPKTDDPSVAATATTALFGLVSFGLSLFSRKRS